MHVFTGLCALSGLILLSPSYGFIGIYCNDGAFAFPRGHTIKLGSTYEKSGLLRIANTSIIILQYTFYDTADYNFCLYLKSLPYTSHRPQISNIIQPWAMMSEILTSPMRTMHKNDNKTSINRDLYNDDQLRISSWYDFRFTENYSITIDSSYGVMIVLAEIHSMKGHSKCVNINFVMDGKKKSLKCGS